MKELNNFRQFLTEGKKEIKEGTWSLGSLREMAATMTQIKGMMRETDPAALLQAFEDLDNIMYNVFGDDGFHDYLGAAKDAVEAGDMDRAKNALGDALGRAMELYKDEEAYRKDRGETGFEFKPRFGLEENDSVLDEILDEGFLDRLKAKAKGAVAGAKATVANIKGDKDGGIKDAAQAAKLKSVIGDLDKDVQDALQNLPKLLNKADVKNSVVGNTGVTWYQTAKKLSDLSQQMMKNLGNINENDAVLDELLNERALYRNPEIPVDKVLQVLQDFYVRDLMRLKQELERSSGEPTAQPGFKAKLEDLMAKLSSFGSSSLGDVEAKVKLKEEKEEVNEAPAVFAEIDQMVGAIKDQMDPDDAFDSLVSEFEAISGGTKLLHQALKNITLDNNLEEIRSAYNEEKGDE